MLEQSCTHISACSAYAKISIYNRINEMSFSIFFFFFLEMRAYYIPCSSTCILYPLAREIFFLLWYAHEMCIACSRQSCQSLHLLPKMHRALSALSLSPNSPPIPTPLSLSALYLDSNDITALIGRQRRAGSIDSSLVSYRLLHSARCIK